MASTTLVPPSSPSQATATDFGCTASSRMSPLHSANRTDSPNPSPPWGTEVLLFTILACYGRFSGRMMVFQHEWSFRVLYARGVNIHETR